MGKRGFLGIKRRKLDEEKIGKAKVIQQRIIETSVLMKNLWLCCDGKNN